MGKLKFLSLVTALVMLMTGCSPGNNVQTAAADTTQAQITESAPETTITAAATPEETQAAETEKKDERSEEEYLQELKSKKVIALTFDDGPNTTTTSEILDLAEQYGIKFSFYVIGQNITEESAKVMKRAHDLGCEINSHSYTHSYMNEMTADEIKDEMQRTSEKIYEIVGEYPKFFRPPYIAVNTTMYDSIDLPFISGMGCNDWDDHVSVEKRIAYVTKKCGDGCIVLLHDAQGNSKTVEALKEIIPYFIEEGYAFVTTDELFKAKGIVPSADKEIIYSYATESGWKEN